MENVLHGEFTLPPGRRNKDFSAFGGVGGFPGYQVTQIKFTGFIAYFMQIFNLTQSKPLFMVEFSGIVFS